MSYRSSCFVIPVIENGNERNLKTVECILSKRVLVVQSLLIHTVLLGET